MKMKKYGNLIVKILVSGLLFYLIFSRIDKTVLLENIKLLDMKFVPLIVGLLIANYVVSSFRWKSLLIHKKSEGVSVKYLTSLYFIGSFFNNFMPTSMGGDVYKVYALGKKIKSTADAFAATFMERFTGVVVLVLISYFGLLKTLDFWLLQLPKNVTDNTFLLFSFKFFLFFGFWILSILGMLSLKFFSTKVTILKKLHDSFLVYRGEYKILFWAIFTSFIVQLIAIFTQYFIFSALGVPLTIGPALFVFPLITLAGFFIPSLNGLGVQDTLYMQFFSLVGVSAELALSASVLYHLFRLGVSLIGGVLYALGKDK